MSEIQKSKAVRMSSLNRAQLIRFLLEYDKSKLAKKTISQLTEQAIETFKFPYTKDMVRTAVKDLQLETKRTSKRGFYGPGKERSGLGNARRIMFLARQVKSLFLDVGKPVPEILELLCKGNALTDEIAPENDAG